MKRLLLVILCLPFVAALGVEGYGLVEREVLAPKAERPAPPKDLQEQLDRAQKTATDLADLQALALLGGASLVKDESISDKELRKLAKTFRKHQETIDLRRKDVLALRANKPENLSDEFRKLFDALYGPDGPEMKLEELKKAVAKTRLPDANAEADLQKKITSCRLSWVELSKGRHGVEKRLSEVTEYLKNCEKVAGLMDAKKLSPADYLELEQIAKAETSPDLVRLAKALAFHSAVKYLPAKLEYSSKLSVWIDAKRFEIDLNDKEVKYLTIGSSTDPIAKSLERQFEDGKLYVEFRKMQREPGSARDFLCPADKSLFAHAYNAARTGLTPGNLPDLQQRIWNEYRDWAKKYSKLNAKLKALPEPMPGPFVTAELTKHFPDEQGIAQILQVMRTCPTLFPPGPALRN